MMKKRLPLFLSFVLFVALCASGAYWGLQLYKPQNRPQLAPPPANPQQELNLSAAAGLFGGNLVVATASNYQLKGVVSSKKAGEGVAILSADGKPAQAVGIGEEIVAGVSLKEVHPLYVLLSEGGVMKRVDMPEGGKGSAKLDGLNFAPDNPPPQPIPVPATAPMGSQQNGQLGGNLPQPPGANPNPAGQQIQQQIAPSMPSLMMGANPANLNAQPGPIEPGPQTGTVVESLNGQK